jgi:hypothetical protein
MTLTIIVFGLIAFLVTMGCALSVYKRFVGSNEFALNNPIHHLLGFVAGSIVVIAGLYIIGFVINKPIVGFL